MGEKDKAEDFWLKKRRAGILYQITGLIVVVLIASGLVTFFLVRDSQNELIDKSMDKIIETEAENISSTLDYLVAGEVTKGKEVLALYDKEQIFADMAQRKITDLQRWAIRSMEDFVGSGIFGLEYLFVVLPPSAMMKEAMVVFSSDESLIYDWEIPAYMIEAIEAETPYLLMEDGIPELGLEGARLILLDKQESPFTPGLYYYYVSVLPMQEKIDAVNAFYAEEREKVSLTLGLSVFLSIIAVVLITFFFLSYLIRKRITRPIDELAAAAEQVMEGNLDVEVAVHEAGEFAGLERAFKEMVESFRKYIDRSTE